MGTSQSVTSAFRYLAQKVLAQEIDLCQIDADVARWLKEIKCGSLSCTRKGQLLQHGLSGREAIDWSNEYIDKIINAHNMNDIATIAQRVRDKILGAEYIPQLPKLYEKFRQILIDIHGLSNSTSNSSSSNNCSSNCSSNSSSNCSSSSSSSSSLTVLRPPIILVVEAFTQIFNFAILTAPLILNLSVTGSLTLTNPMLKQTSNNLTDIEHNYVNEYFSQPIFQQPGTRLLSGTQAVETYNWTEHQEQSGVIRKNLNSVFQQVDFYLNPVVAAEVPNGGVGLYYAAFPEINPTKPYPFIIFCSRTPPIDANGHYKTFAQFVTIMASFGWSVNDVGDLWYNITTNSNVHPFPSEPRINAVGPLSYIFYDASPYGANENYYGLCRLAGGLRYFTPQSGIGFPIWILLTSVGSKIEYRDLVCYTSDYVQSAPEGAEITPYSEVFVLTTQYGELIVGYDIVQTFPNGAAIVPIGAYGYIFFNPGFTIESDFNTLYHTLIRYQNLSYEFK